SFAHFFHFSYLNRPSSTFFISCFRKPTSFIFLLLLLAGDVEISPGPTPSTFTALNLSHLNIRSASSITPNLDKPALLHEFPLLNLPALDFLFQQIHLFLLSFLLSTVHLPPLSLISSLISLLFSRTLLLLTLN